MALQRTLQDLISAFEILQLIRKVILPFHTMEQIVPIPKNDDERRQHAISCIVVAPI